MLHIKFSLHTDDVSQKIQACTLQPSHIGKEESLSVLFCSRGVLEVGKKFLIFWRETYQSHQGRGWRSMWEMRALMVISFYRMVDHLGEKEAAGNVVIIPFFGPTH